MGAPCDALTAKFLPHSRSLRARFDVPGMRCSFQAAAVRVCLIHPLAEEWLERPEARRESDDALLLPHSPLLS